MLWKWTLGTHRPIHVGPLTHKPTLGLLQGGKRENKVSILPNVLLVKLRNNSHCLVMKQCLLVAMAFILAITNH